MLIALTFAAAVVIGLVVTPIVRHYAHRLQLLDEPGGRKIHLVAIPRLGGVAMFIAFGVAIGLAFLASPGLGSDASVRPDRLPAILIAASLLFIVGVVDDVRGMRALVKLVFQIVAALIVWGIGLSIDRLHFPWGMVELGVLALPVTVLWIVGVINAVNLIDGLDGLASGVVLTGLGAFGLIAASSGMMPVLPVVAATMGAAIGFLAYNLHPASIIMGDTGSMFLGLIVSTAAISLTQHGLQPVPPWVPIIALGLPIADTIWAVLRRTARGEAVFAPDRGHIHHQLLEHGLSQRDAMLSLTALSAALGIAAVLLARVA